MLTLAAGPSEPLGWAYPDGRGATPAAGWDTTAAISVPNGEATFNEAQLHDFFGAPDWRPKSHPAAPNSVMIGRRPDAYACGYCHLPDGVGRPENAALAGLPKGYIVRQVRAFASGQRKAPTHDWLPSDLMSKTAKAATAQEIESAAAYFSRLPFTPRVKVVETETLPAPKALNFLFVPGGPKAERLGARIVEAPESTERFEHRDAQVTYLAQVPLGSLARGAVLAKGVDGVQACGTCHGGGLRGGFIGPPLAGRSPSYLFRQLYAFQSGARGDPDAASMKAVVAGLSPSDMIALAAYAGSLKP